MPMSESGDKPTRRSQPAANGVPSKAATGRIGGATKIEHCPGRGPSENGME